MLPPNSYNMRPSANNIYVYILRTCKHIRLVDNYLYCSIDFTCLFFHWVVITRVVRRRRALKGLSHLVSEVTLAESTIETWTSRKGIDNFMSPLCGYCIIICIRDCGQEQSFEHFRNIARRLITRQMNIYWPLRELNIIRPYQRC